MIRSALLNVMVEGRPQGRRAAHPRFRRGRELQVSLKGPANFVSAADQRAEEIAARRTAQGAARAMAFIGEEGGKHRGHRQVAHLDRRSARRHDQFPARHPAFRHLDRARARRHDCRGRSSTIRSPTNCFIAERGKGAFLNDKRIRVAARKRMREAVVACGLPHHGRGDLELFRTGIRGDPGTGRGASPVRRRGARSRLGRRRPARRLLGTQPVAVGHRGRHADRARSRRLRHRLDGKDEHVRHRAISLPATRRCMRELLKMLKAAVEGLKSALIAR